MSVMFAVSGPRSVGSVVVANVIVDEKVSYGPVGAPVPDLVASVLVPVSRVMSLLVPVF